jgi:hypothetical protein
MVDGFCQLRQEVLLRHLRHDRPLLGAVRAIQFWS